MTLPLQLVILGWVAQCLFLLGSREDNTPLPHNIWQLCMVYFSLCFNNSDRWLLFQLKMIATVTIVFHVHRIEKRLEITTPSPESRSNTSSSRENSPKSPGDPSNQWTFRCSETNGATGLGFSGWKPAGRMPLSHRTVMENSSFSPRMNLFVCFTSILWAITISVLWQPRNGIWMDLNLNQPKFGRVYLLIREVLLFAASLAWLVQCTVFIRLRLSRYLRYPIYPIVETNSNHIVIPFLIRYTIDIPFQAHLVVPFLSISH